MKKHIFLSILAVVLSTLVLPTATRAKTPSSESVKTGDTFDFDIAGFNNSGTGYLLTPDETATFGTPQTYTAAGPNGQNITITSTESIGATTTTDTVTVSTAMSFITTKAYSGISITQLQLDIGNANAGGNTIDYSSPVTSYSATGYYNQYENATNYALTPSTTLTSNNESLAAAEGVNFGSGNYAYLYEINSFTYSITYSDVPESSSFGVAGGVLGLLLSASRLRRSWA